MSLVSGYRLVGRGISPGVRNEGFFVPGLGRFRTYSPLLWNQE
jgi:hypothetical protein